MRDTNRIFRGLWPACRGSWERENWSQRRLIQPRHLPVPGGSLECARLRRINWGSQVQYAMCYGNYFGWERIINSGGDLLGWRWRLRSHGWRRAGRRSVVKPPPDIFNNPIDTLYDIVSSHGTARHDRPLVGLDSIQVKSLKHRQSTTFIAKSCHEPQLTIRMSALVIAPPISCLFANTSKDAPASLCW